MLRLSVAILLAGTLRAQSSVPETKDPLGRSTPQESVFQFLETCHARNYSKALYYLDLRRMPDAVKGSILGARESAGDRCCRRRVAKPWRNPQERNAILLRMASLNRSRAVSALA